jgi:hypothetical protein
MNRNLSIVICTAIIAIAGLFYAFIPNKPATVGATKFMQVTTIESIVPGGMGRSKMLVTSDGGIAKEEGDLENFYSLVGINFGNICKNEKQIVDKINALTADGWVLQHVTSGVQSPTDKGSGIYCTRYLFAKAQ